MDYQLDVEIDQTDLDTLHQRVSDLRTSPLRSPRYGTLDKQPEVDLLNNETYPSGQLPQTAPGNLTSQSSVERLTSPLIHGNPHDPFEASTLSPYLVVASRGVENASSDTPSPLSRRTPEPVHPDRPLLETLEGLIDAGMLNEEETLSLAQPVTVLGGKEPASRRRRQCRPPCRTLWSDHPRFRQDDDVSAEEASSDEKEGEDDDRKEATNEVEEDGEPGATNKVIDMDDEIISELEMLHYFQFRGNPT